MKKLIFAFALFLICVGGQAQVAIVNYMKVKSGGDDAFLANERQWKKLHQQRVNEGKMNSWFVCYVYGSGTATPYNYVTIDVYPDLKTALQGITVDDLKKVFGEKYTDVTSKTTGARELTYSEIYNWRMGIQGKEPSKFFMVSYMKIKKDNYYTMEEKAFKPMHQALIDAGNMNGWAVWSRAFSNDTKYDASTVNSFVSLDQLTKYGYNDQVLEKGLAGQKGGAVLEVSALINDTANIREIVKSQLWEVVEQTSPKPKQ